MATHTSNKKVETTALLVTTPKAFAGPIRNLLEAAVFGNKTLQGFVPVEMKRAEPDVYYNVLVRHAKYIHNHRNIPITNIQSQTFDREIRPTLEKNKDIVKIYIDVAKNKANISTTAVAYQTVCEWIDHALEGLKLEYQPYRVDHTEGSIRTGKTAQSKYAQLFCDDLTMATDGSSFDPSTIQTPRSNAWTRRLPVKIVYSTKAEDFPPLPTQPAARTIPTTATLLTETTDNMAEMIAAAVKKVEEKQEQKMEEFTKAMKARMDILEKSLETLVTQVIEATYKSLTTSGTFATKEDTLKLHSDVDMMNKKLDALMIALTPGNQITGSPPRKSPRWDDTPPHSSATLTRDSEMSERED